MVTAYSLSSASLITKPFTFAGKALEINYSTSAAGEMRVERQGADGKSLQGLALDDCEPIYGDHIAGGQVEER